MDGAILVVTMATGVDIFIHISTDICSCNLSITTTLTVTKETMLKSYFQECLIFSMTYLLNRLITIYLHFHCSCLRLNVTFQVFALFNAKH